MERLIDIKEIERRAYSPLRNDGVEDILAGVVLFTFGALLTEQGSPPIGIFFLPFVAWFLRLFVTFPRVGYLKPSKSSPSERLAITLLAVSGFTATALLALIILNKKYPTLMAFQFLPASVMHAALAAVLIVFLSAMGFYSGMRRWYLYAVLAAVCAVLTMFLRGWLPVDGIAAFSVLITIWGVVMLARFVRKYPVREKEAIEEPAGGNGK